MKKFYVLLISMFVLFTESTSWADTIDAVTISDGPPVIVEITGTFACDDGARAPFTFQTSVENKIIDPDSYQSTPGLHSEKYPVYRSGSNCSS